MSEVHRFALVPYSPQQMFDLVRDVSSYPAFLSWIDKALVHDETDETQLATLGLNLASIRPEFTTQNAFEAPHRVVMRLVEGPFKQLSGQWEFIAVGMGSKVTLDLKFEMAHAVWAAALGKGFSRVADRMVDDFCRRAVEVYGHEG